MRFGMFRALAALTVALQAGSALAFFDAQVLAGKRWYELGGDYKGHVSSQETGVAVHIDPIPVLPVAFGASAMMGTLNKDQLGGSDVKEAKSFEAGLDIMAWIPAVPVVTPYGRLRYPLVATRAIKFEALDPTGAKTVEYASTDKLSGPHLGLGVKWSPLPILKFLVEVERGMQTIKADETKIADEKVTDSSSGSAPSNAFYLGVELGL